MAAARNFKSAALVEYAKYCLKRQNCSVSQCGQNLLVIFFKLGACITKLVSTMNAYVHTHHKLNDL